MLIWVVGQASARRARGAPIDRAGIFLAAGSHVTVGALHLRRNLREANTAALLLTNRIR